MSESGTTAGARRPASAVFGIEHVFSRPEELARRLGLCQVW
jgi:hypothetical protein